MAIHASLTIIIQDGVETMTQMSSVLMTCVALVKVAQPMIKAVGTIMAMMVVAVRTIQVMSDVMDLAWAKITVWASYMAVKRA